MERPRLAIATCAEHPGLAADDLALFTELEARGVTAEPVVWNAAGVDWAGFDACLLRSVWDYHLRRADFLAWSEGVAAAMPLWNGSELVAWNTSKRYLRELAAAGVPTIPTVWLRRGVPARLDELIAAGGWREAVLKPTVDLGAERLARVSGAAADQVLLDALLGEHEVMAQPFLPSVERDGETSLVYFEGELSHAVRKLPRGGDFRVQARWGGSAVAVEPSAAQREVAGVALAALGDEPPLYARVDLVEGEGEGGQPLLIELELVEPNLYLASAPGAAGTLAAALAQRLRG